MTAAAARPQPMTSGTPPARSTRATGPAPARPPANWPPRWPAPARPGRSRACRPIRPTTFAIKAIDEAGNCVGPVQRGQQHDADHRRAEQAGADRAGLRVPRGIQTADERHGQIDWLRHGGHRDSPRQRQSANPGHVGNRRRIPPSTSAPSPAGAADPSTWPQSTVIHDWGTAVYGSPSMIERIPRRSDI